MCWAPGDFAQSYALAHEIGHYKKRHIQMTLIIGILQKHKVEKLLLVNGQGDLTGLITMRDIDRVQQYPLAARDRQGRDESVLQAIRGIGVVAQQAIPRLPDGAPMLFEDTLPVRHSERASRVGCRLYKLCR